PVLIFALGAGAAATPASAPALLAVAGGGFRAAAVALVVGIGFAEQVAFHREDIVELGSFFVDEFLEILLVLGGRVDGPVLVLRGFGAVLVEVGRRAVSGQAFELDVHPGLVVGVHDHTVDGDGLADAHIDPLVEL